MAECIDPIPTENLDSCSRDEVLPGVVETDVYAALVRDFTTIEYVPAYADGTDYASLGTIAAAHTFPAEKGFHKITLRVDTGMVDAAQLGEKGNLTVQNNLTGVVPSTDAPVVGWVRKHINLPMIFLVRERSGKLKQIGSRNSPAYMTEITPTSGTKPGDAKGTTLKFADTQMHPAPIYAGTITEFTPVVP